MRGGITGPATPYSTLIPEPPPQVEMLKSGFSAAAASILFQLFAIQTSPVGSIDGSVRIGCMLPCDPDSAGRCANCQHPKDASPLDRVPAQANAAENDDLVHCGFSTGMAEETQLN